MKRRFIQICSFIGLLIGLTVSAQAQGVRQYEASIPFDFNVGNKSFQAGDYAIGLTNPLAMQETLTIRNLKSREAEVFLVTRNQANAFAAASRLIFNRYGDRYFLSEMATPALSAEFLRAKAETRLARKNPPRRETVALKK